MWPYFPVLVQHSYLVLLDISVSFQSQPLFIKFLLNLYNLIKIARSPAVQSIIILDQLHYFLHAPLGLSGVSEAFPLDLGSEIKGVGPFRSTCDDSFNYLVRLFIPTICFTVPGSFEISYELII